MRKISVVVVLMIMLLVTAVAQAKVILGIERLDEPEVQSLLVNKRVGLFTNQSGVDSDFRSSVELLAEHSQLEAIFVPEHGLFGAVAAGKEFKDYEYNKIPVFSLYGGNRRPTKEMLDKIDTIVVDVQDVGIRHYTYFSSLAYIMEECAKFGKQVIVLDRPNPLGGMVQGPVLKPEYSSFIGLYSIPLRHGLTIGEFARYINGEYKIGCQLQVVPMKDYHKDMLWKDTKLPWVLTSPLIPTAETATLYGVTGILGDSSLSIGTGTAQPFMLVGMNGADAEVVKKALDDLHLAGVKFRAASFSPCSGKCSGKLLQGVQIYIMDIEKVNLPELQYLIMEVFRGLYPDKITFPERYGAKGYKIDIALGEDSMRLGEPHENVFPRWQKECQAFKEKAAPYLLYK